MAFTATIGAPSLAGEGANNEPSIAGFSGAAYPLLVRFTNLMPRELALPEVGLTLGHCAGGAGRAASATVTRYQTLRDLAARIGQIADLNAYAAALSLEEVEAAETTRPAKPVKIKEAQK